MYWKNNPKQLSFENDHLPFRGKLCSANRWIIPASLGCQ